MHNRRMAAIPDADAPTAGIVNPTAEAMDARPTFGTLGLDYVRAQHAELVAQEPGVRKGEDVEAVHDMRVATRRLRAALRVFEEAFGPEAATLHEEIGWLGRGLGAVRDRDVQ